MTKEEVLEEVEWTNTGHEESVCRDHESTGNDHDSACRGLKMLQRGCESAVEVIKVTVEAVREPI
jgi:hypothetical protein